ncbi:MAG TPA: hypothetical protein VHG91_18870 [Longimicrobium sp.]|nr:hypothetical protein [Longimicrobium sp.]
MSESENAPEEAGLGMRAGERRLVSIRRYVPPDERETYAALWLALRTAATERGAHAWHFLSADVPDVFLEFLEFGAESDIRADVETLAAIRALHEQFGQPYPPPATIEEWVEIPAPGRGAA